MKLHSCGNTTHLLTGIADLGVQVFDVDDMMNLRQSCDAVGGRSVITGNVEPVEVVLKSTPGQSVTPGREAYEQMGNPPSISSLARIWRARKFCSASAERRVSCQSVGMRKTFRKPDLALP